MAHGMSRRRFLNRTAKCAAAGMAMPILPRAASAQKASPNDRITLGFVGLGGMGTGHLRGLVHHPEVQILACCDTYEKNRMSAKERVDEVYENADCAVYNDFRNVMDRDDIDTVLIATPDHWHTRICLAACEAGKDIYCQKPLTLTIGEGKKLVKTVRRYGTVFQVGSQQRSSGNFRYACELVRSGKIGGVHTVTAFLPNGPTGNWHPDEPAPDGLDWDMYLGPSPWVPYNRKRFQWDFRWFFAYSGGQMTDWGAHHIDIAQWGLGMDKSGPISIDPIEGTKPQDGLFETYTSFRVECMYETGVKLVVTNPEHGTRFEGTDGWIQVWRGGMDAEPKSLLHEPIGANDVHLYTSPGHEQDWINCVRSRKRPICDVETGHRSVTVPHLCNIALRLGRKLNWDPVEERFVGDDEANRWLFRPYRDPWVL